MCLHTSVNLSRGRAVTNVGRTCGPTPLLVLLVILSCNKICLYYEGALTVVVCDCLWVWEKNKALSNITVFTEKLS